MEKVIDHPEIVIQKLNVYGSVVELVKKKDVQNHPPIEDENGKPNRVFRNGDKRSNRWSNLKLIYKFLEEIKTNQHIDDSNAAIEADMIRNEKKMSMSQFVNHFLRPHFNLVGNRRPKRQSRQTDEATMEN